MDYHYFKDILNNFYARYVGRHQRPTFFDLNAFPELNNITAHWQEIKKEYAAITENVSQLPRYHDIDPGEVEISNSTAKNWNVYMLYLLGYQIKQAQVLCPQLCSLLKNVPNLIQAFFSILEPGKSIPLHDGPYLGYLRYHLGIQIPKDNPPSIIVNKQPYTWKEGEAVMFDDSWSHQVINNSNEHRVVLIIDILRPMPLLPHLVNQFVTNVIAKYTYGRKTIKRASEFDQEVKPFAA